jgi:peptidoglycan/LPS O-acetylase OafA/YrhL
MKINYRPEIDGLRAIAVFSVITYHARDTFLPGGFLGVDIFFVISGYLITSLILKELKLTNKFSFSNFYERRVRRIIPALLGMIILSTFISYITLLPDSFVDFSKSLISSIFSVSNFYFLYTGNLYGAESSLLKPLLHTWSLSVEEQFYILLPVTVFVIYKFFRKHLLTLIFSGILISLIFSQYISSAHSSSSAHSGFNFYLLPSRGFELLLGSLLAKLELDNGRMNRNSSLILNKILPIIGLSLIFYSLIFFNDKMLLPSFYSLVPIIGTMLVIWFSHKDELVTQILSNRSIVFFGLISYSLYLFHFPVLAFARYLNLLDNNLFILIFFVILISSLSYYFIERPFRNKKIISFRKLSISLIITIMGLIFFNSYVIYKDGIKERFPKIFHNLKTKEKINFNKQGIKGNVVLIGDSHSDAIAYHLNEKLIKESFNLSRFITRLYVKNLNQYNYLTNQINESFINGNLKIEEYINKENNLIVVLHQRWTLSILSTYFDNEEGITEYDNESENLFDKIKPTSENINEQQRIILVRKSIVSSINSILEKNHKVILVYPVPENAFDVPRLIHNKLNKTNINVPILSTSYDVYKKRNKFIFETLDSIQNDNIYRVYPHKHFCDNQIKNRCVSNSKDKIYYFNDDHLSLQGSTFVVRDIVDIIKKINN